MTDSSQRANRRVRKIGLISLQESIIGFKKNSSLNGSSLIKQVLLWYQKFDLDASINFSITMLDTETDLKRKGI